MWQGTTRSRCSLLGGHETVAKGVTDADMPTGDDVLYSPDPSFEDSYGVAGACVLERAKESHEISVRLMNPGEGSVKLHKGTVVGYVEGVARVYESLAPPQVRSLEQRNTEAGGPQESEAMEKLVSESDLTSESERNKTRELLRKYQDRFPADGSLGRSGLVKHEISTEGAPPRAVQPVRVDHARVSGSMTWWKTCWTKRL